ncbi:conserved hypothetical protein, membrane [Candidatus Magnetobacterium bavaricum]|uniref:DUF2142 domain-containing protein n=1 Tax=Candidatus Magnetobacterium bavaricum TaxID=29290 RepID=A0A0F3GT19_9BACT|nr:conserved hypothetical protein, membrane [Candidatus Magnetobacterium bavaricum]
MFVFLAGCFGVILLFLIPPFQSPDEYAHFYRAYQISEGRMVAEINDDYIGGYLPESFLITAMGLSKRIPYPLAIGVSIVNPNFNKNEKLTLSDFKPLLKLPVNSQRRIFLSFQNTTSYSPIPYLPHQLGFMIGRLFNFSPILLFYAARACNLLIWICVVFIAIKTVPILKWVFFLLALNPMSLFIASTLSADAFTNAISYLVIAVFVRYAYDDNKEINIKDILIIFTLSALLSLSKQAYYLILFLFLLIPINKMKTVKDKKYGRIKYLSVFIALITVNLLLVMSWSSIVRDIVMIPFSYSTNISPHQQMSFILSHPLTYCRTIFNTFFIERHFYLYQIIGVFGWLDTPMPASIVYSYCLLLVTLSFVDRDKRYVIPKVKKILIFTIMMSTILAIITIGYLFWVPVGADSINGIQGRYFLPVLPLLMLLLYNTKISNQNVIFKNSVFEKHLKVIEYLRNNKTVVDLSIVSYSFFALGCTLSVLFHRYWA